MRIAHIAVWTRDIDRLCKFYVDYFSACCGAPYHNPAKGFRSVFISFGEGGAALEAMSRDDLSGRTGGADAVGYAHIAIGTGSREEVDRLTERLREDGYEILGEPRLTGDGYYESVVADPDGNRVEITA